MGFNFVDCFWIGLTAAYFESLDQQQRQRYTNDDGLKANSSGVPLEKEASSRRLKEWKTQRRQQYLDSMKFRKNMQAVIAGDFELHFGIPDGIWMTLTMSGRDIEVQAWMAHLTLVRNLSQILCSCVPDFWRLCRAFLEGKYHAKVSSVSLSHLVCSSFCRPLIVLFVLVSSHPLIFVSLHVVRSSPLGPRLISSAYLCLSFMSSTHIPLCPRLISSAHLYSSRLRSSAKQGRSNTRSHQEKGRHQSQGRPVLSNVSKARRII